MTRVATSEPAAASERSSATASLSPRAEALAARLEQGARALAVLAARLTDDQWQTRLPGDGRKIGVVVHHVGNMYPLEIQLAQQLAAGRAITGVTMNEVNAINAAHAKEFAAVGKNEALDFLLRNSAAAAAAIRALSDDDLDRAVPQSLYGGAELTCQFFLEDHPVRHAIHHLAKIRAALPARAAAV